jgi:Fe2+ or Zn2+ uptake regulation protein
MNPVMKPDDVPPAQQLRSAGLRATAQRGAVLDRLAGHPHASVDDLGFMVDEAEVVLWGSCTSCLRGAAVLS